MDLTIKDNLNFLENSFFSVDDKINKDFNLQEYLYNTENSLPIRNRSIMVGTEDEYYKILTPYRFPTKKDKLILDYFLTLGKTKNSCFVSIYKIAKDLFNSKNSDTYERIKDSIKRWYEVSIEFKKTFYKNKKFISSNFRIITDYHFLESGLNVNFGENYLKELETNNFYKVYSLSSKIKLTPFSCRLFELLLRRTANGKKSVFDKKLLIEKLFIKDCKPNELVKKINKSLESINANTELFIKFSYNKENKIFIFESLEKIETKSLENDYDNTEKELSNTEKEKANLARQKTSEMIKNLYKAKR